MARVTNTSDRPYGTGLNLVSSVGNVEKPTEHPCGAEEIRQWNQQLMRSNTQTAVLKMGNAHGTFFIMEIGEVSQHRRYETPILSDAVYSYRFERLMGIRIYPNGVGSGRGTHVAIFIHMMESTFDDLLDWPYAGTITVSVLDRSGSRARSDISQIIQAKPNLLAFQQPYETICRTGYGYERFAIIEEFFGPRYVKNDKLLLKIEFSG
ncbi:TNF receptor-associated factor 6-like [Montipora capricornis]|uniref:TNF receptor-associated factor 6-like n=1 Tax=Montipora capricornis TaxID=246305 RepID=UPI0035F16BC6